MDTTRKLGEMKIPKLILTMSLPAIIAMMVQATYNVVDSIFVSRISEEALTAVSLAFPIQMIIISICVGVGIGINSVISRKLGEGNKDEAVNAAEHGFVIGVIVWALMALCAISLPRRFFSLFTENQEIINLATQYITIILVFSFGRILAQVCMSILQATGDMVSSMKIQLLGAIINIALDPLLIFGLLFIPALGIKGAAIATVLGQICSMLLAFALLFLRKNKVLKLDLKKFHYNPKTTKRILTVGIPAMIMQGLSSVMIAALNIILGGFTDTAVAVLGVYFKVQSFIFMPVFGLSQGIMPIIGFNYGAGNKKRIIETIKIGALIALSIMFVGMLVFQIFPAQLLKIFKASEQMTEIGIIAFRSISSGFLLAAIAIVISTGFQAIGNAVYSLILSLIRQIVILLPCAYILSITFGLNQTWLAFPIAELLAFLVLIVLTITTYNKKIKNLVPIDTKQ